MTATLELPQACARTLEGLREDPLATSPGLTTHLQACPACREARVLLLAQEEPPDSLAPADYFARLPDRVLRKLPSRPRVTRLHPLAWAVAATLLMAVGAGAFWAGRANRTPLVEATLPPKAEDDILATSADTPFHDGVEDAAPLQSLSPEEMKALLKRLDANAAPSSPR